MSISQTPEAQDQQVPEPFRSIVDRVCAKDAAFFKRHPSRTHYYRRAIAGEMWPWQTPSRITVLVRQHQPGIRSRDFGRSTFSPYQVGGQTTVSLETTQLIVKDIDHPRPV